MATKKYNISEITFLPKPTTRGFLDIEGQTFNRLTVLGYAGTYAGNRNSMWFCQCVCGNITKINGSAIRNKRTLSCGCLQLEAVSVATTRHGKHLTSEYRIWVKLRNRCYNPRNDKYSRYGERGITVCARWRESFAAFLEDVGERPTPKLTLDRIQNDGGYWCGKCEECVANDWPSNCHWATRREQSNNREVTPMITLDNRTQSLADWCREKGLRRSTIANRIWDGWNPVEALLTPVKHKRLRPRLTTT